MHSVETRTHQCSMRLELQKTDRSKIIHYQEATMHELQVARLQELQRQRQQTRTTTDTNHREPPGTPATHSNGPVPAVPTHYWTVSSARERKQREEEQ